MSSKLGGRRLLFSIAGHMSFPPVDRDFQRLPEFGDEEERGRVREEEEGRGRKKRMGKGNGCTVLA